MSLQFLKNLSFDRSTSIHFHKEWTIPLLSFGLAILFVLFFALTKPEVQKPQEPPIVPIGKPHLSQGTVIYSDALPKPSQKEGM